MNIEDTTLKCFFHHPDGALGRSDVTGCESYNEAISIVVEHIKAIDSAFKKAVMVVVK